MRALALREARREYREYSLSIPVYPVDHTALASTILRRRADPHGRQSPGAGRASSGLGTPPGRDPPVCPILDNNIVADFASRALTDLDLSLLHLFAMAQKIAGYAFGRVLDAASVRHDRSWPTPSSNEIWTERSTPMQWIREMTQVSSSKYWPRAPSQSSSGRKAELLGWWG